MTSVRDVLAQHGPSLSSAVAARLGGASADAARKQIERAKDVLRCRTFTFPNRESFLYLGEHTGTDRLLDALQRALRETNTVYGHALDALIGRGGVVPTDVFDVVSGAPLRAAKRATTSDVLSALQKENMVKRVVFGPDDSFVTSFDFEEQLFARARARLVAEGVLLGALHDWVRKTGFGSYDKVAIRGSSSPRPEMGQFAWDLTAPSYLLPLKAHVKESVKPGFVVADVALANELDVPGVQYFVRKCSAVHGQRNSRPFLPFLVANHFSREAHALGKKWGLAFVTPETLFGEDIARALQELIRVLTDTAKAVADPAALGRLFADLSKIEGAAANLRGPLFELLVGQAAQTHGGRAEVGKRVKVPDANEHVEIDVLLDRPGTVHAFECKGHAPGAEESLDDVKDWVTRQVPRIRKYLLSQSLWSDSKMVFEYWSTGRFSDEAEAYLQERKKGTSKYQLAWKNGQEVLDFLKRANLGHLVKVLSEHYIDHPLAELRGRQPSQPAPTTAVGEQI